MKKFRSAGFLFAILLILGAIANWDEWQTKKDKEAEESSKKLLQLSPGDVSAVKFVDDGTLSSESDENRSAKMLEIELSRDAATKEWHISSPINEPADNEAVETILSTIRDYKYDKEISKDRQAWPKFGLEPNHRRIELKTSSSDKPIIIYVGNKAPVGYSVYAATSADDRVFVGSQYLQISTNKILRDFRNKAVISFSVEKMQNLTFERPNQSPIVLAKNGDKVEITSPASENADFEIVSAFASELSKIKAEDFYDQPSEKVLSSFQAPNLLGKFKIETQGGNSIEFSVAKSESNVLLAIQGKKTIFKISADIEDKLKKTIDDFRDKRIFHFKSTDIKSVKIDGTEYQVVNGQWHDSKTAQKFSNDGNWTGGGKIPASLDHIRSLLVDLEFAKAARQPNNDSPESTLTKLNPKHQVQIGFKDELKLANLVIDAWTFGEKAEEMVLKSSGSSALFVVPATVFRSVTPAKEQEPGTANDQGGTSADRQEIAPKGTTN